MSNPIIEITLLHPFSLYELKKFLDDAEECGISAGHQISVLDSDKSLYVSTEAE